MTDRTQTEARQAEEIPGAPPVQKPSDRTVDDATWARMRAEWFATGLMAEWEIDYPEAAKARADEADAREAKKMERICYSHVYNQRD